MSRGTQRACTGTPPRRLAGIALGLLLTGLLAGPGRAAEGDAGGDLRFDDGRVYIGPVVDGQPDGKGTMIWPDGHRYEGAFEAGEMSGEGRFEYPDGTRYRGEVAHGRPDGLGTFRWPDHSRYTGEYQAGVRQGWGEYRWPDGARYVGGFRADERTGQGTLIDADGTLYRGRFRDGRRDGVGVRVSANGASLTLERWKNGVQQSSRAIRASQDCVLHHAGRRWMVLGSRCIDGLAHGRGDAVSTDGTLWIDEGRFVLGQLVAGRAIALGQPPETAQ